jgi:hypothetical protein
MDVGEINDVEYRKLSMITIDTTKFVANDGTVDTEMMERYNAFKDLLFGNDGAGGVGAIQAHLPEPSTVVAYFGASSKYTYTIQHTEPTDWDTNFMDYYTKSGSTYTKVGDLAEAPEFVADTYYKRTFVGE